MVVVGGSGRAGSSGRAGAAHLKLLRAHRGLQVVLHALVLALLERRLHGQGRRQHLWVRAAGAGAGAGRAWVAAAVTRPAAWAARAAARSACMAACLAAAFDSRRRVSFSAASWYLPRRCQV